MTNPRSRGGSGPPTTSLLGPVQELARLAGAEAYRHFGTGVAVDIKSDGSPVTIADRRAEEVARRWIARYFPGDGILGEELGDYLPEAPRRWVIDPIDGTKTFVRGVPLWGTLVAVCRGMSVIAGAAFFPAVNEMLAAARGEGCWWNGTRTVVSKVAEISAATVLTTDERFPNHPDRARGWERLARAAALSRSWGDCYGYLLVATGRAEVMADAILNPWDAAPLLPCIAEAGGVFTDWSGVPSGFGSSAVATNAALAAPARELLGVPVT